MTVYVTKPAINLREALADLGRDEGLVGLQLLSSDTATEAVEALNLEDHTFVTFNSTGIDDNATSTKLTVSDTGIDVTGTVTADGLTVGAVNGLVLDSNGATDASWTHNPVDGESTISVGRNAGWGGDLNINTDTLRRMRIQNNGDISFYEDTGTTPKFFWDASAESLGIGTSSPQGKLEIVGSTGSAGTSGGTAIIRQKGDTSADGIAITSSNAISHRIWKSAGGSLNIGPSTSPSALVQDSSGNVGIGTSSPVTNLDIVSASATGLTVRNTGTVSSILLSNDSTGNSIYSRGANSSTGRDFRFYQGSTEAMRINSLGSVLVGTTSNGAKLAVVSSENQTKVYVEGYGTGSGRGIDMKAGVDAASAIVFNNSSGTVVGSITQSTTATAYNTSSDYRLKTDVQPMTGASARVQSLKPCNFAWKVDGSRTDGFLAHEAQEVVPEAVTGEKDGEEMQAIDQSKLVPLLTAALQEALAKIDALETRITALEG